MFTLLDRRPVRNCQGLARREFLRIGALGGGLGWSGLSLAGLMESRARAASSSFVRAKSVVLLFLQGGPSHLELFDPKQTAPVDIRGIFGEIATRLPGITFGSHFPQLAALADRLAIVRSYGSQNSGHTYQEVLSARNPLKATLGSLYARVVGNNHPRSGMPTNTLVLPEAVAPNLKLGSNFETGALPTLTEPGDLGGAYRAFNPVGGGQLQQNMELRTTPERLADRRGLLDQLDQLRRRADHTGLLSGTTTYQQQAFDVILGGVGQAFDLSREDPRTVARYDTSHLFRNETVQAWGDMRRSSNQLGRQMLLARRLVEAGCGFVTVSDCGWDMHSNGNSPKGLAGMQWLAPQVDHAVAAFIEDLKERGLTDDVLLIVTGEMGRTPRINKNGGRDHYGDLTPLLLHGGGLRLGQVVGQSDAQAARPATTPHDPRHLLSTVLNTLFDVGQMRLARELPREIIKLTEDSPPIAGLLA